MTYRIVVDKVDLARLVAGHDLALMCYTHEVKMAQYQEAGLGSYTGGFRDDWHWRFDNLMKLSEQELFDIWQELKNAPPNKPRTVKLSYWPIQNNR